MPTWKYGPRVRACDLQPGQMILLPRMHSLKLVTVDRVRPIDDIYTAIHTTGGTMWQLSPRTWVTTVVPEDSEPLSGTKSA